MLRNFRQCIRPCFTNVLLAVIEQAYNLRNRLLNGLSKLGYKADQRRSAQKFIRCTSL